MINRAHFGKRVARLRRGLRLSQGELGEKLGVTAQAVSKWECGAALPDLDVLLELSHLYGVSINDLLEDRDLVAQLADRKSEFDGVHYFVPREEPERGRAWGEAMTAEGWVPRNWHMAREGNWPMGREAAKRIIGHGGLILEIGAGPGGGFMPYVLEAAPEASIIVSDLSPTVVREWKQFLDRELDSPGLGFAAFDFTDIPFRDGSFDVVADRSGIGNAENTRGEAVTETWARALKEVYRVLKPGGLLVSQCGFVTRETMLSLPEEVRRVLKKERPEIFQSLYEETVLAGFRDIHSEICGYWDTDNDESSIADLARTLGVNLRFTEYVRYCVK